MESLCNGFLNYILCELTKKNQFIENNVFFFLGKTMWENYLLTLIEKQNNYADKVKSFCIEIMLTEMKIHCMYSMNQS